MNRHLYQVRYLRRGSVSRVHRMTVVARDADEARAYAALRDPEFGSTVKSPRRGAVVEPEQADGLTAAKAEAFR